MLNAFNRYVRFLLEGHAPTGDFRMLPENLPYGFLVDPAGKITTIPRNDDDIGSKLFAHDDIVTMHYPKYIMPKSTGAKWTEMLNAGFIRIVCEPDCLIANQVRPTVAALRTARDIAKFYNVNYAVDPWK